MANSFRFYYDKDLDYLYNEEVEWNNPFTAMNNAKRRLRMYANCIKCGSDSDIELDHIIPISKGGKNVIENIQYLCSVCNLKKSNKL